MTSSCSARESAGQNVADRPRKLRVAVVERELVGGECSGWARSLAAVRSSRSLTPDGSRRARSSRRLDHHKAGVLAAAAMWPTGDDTGQADWVSGIGATLIRVISDWTVRRVASPSHGSVADRLACRCHLRSAGASTP